MSSLHLIQMHNSQSTDLVFGQTSRIVPVVAGNSKRRVVMKVKSTTPEIPMLKVDIAAPSVCFFTIALLSQVRMRPTKTWRTALKRIYSSTMFAGKPKPGAGI